MPETLRKYVLVLGHSEKRIPRPDEYRRLNAPVVVEGEHPQIANESSHGLRREGVERLVPDRMGGGYR